MIEIKEKNRNIFFYLLLINIVIFLSNLFKYDKPKSTLYKIF
jgi:hypothetical protein